MKRVLVVDDEILVRLGIRSILGEGELGYLVVGEAAGGREGEALVASLTPDILLTDLMMAAGDGISLITATRKIRPETAIVVLSARNDFEFVREALRAGADDYVFKPTLKTGELVECFERALAKHPGGGKVSGQDTALGDEGPRLSPLALIHGGARSGDSALDGTLMTDAAAVYCRPWRILALVYGGRSVGTGSMEGRVWSPLPDLLREMARIEPTILDYAASGGRACLALVNEGRSGAARMFALAEEYGHRYLGSLPRGGLSSPGFCAAELILRYGEARDAAEAAYRGNASVNAPLVFAEDLARTVLLAESPVPPSGCFRPDVYAASCARLRHAVEALDGSAISSAFKEILDHLAQSADRDAARLGALALEACIPFKERARALGLDPETSLPGLWPEVSFAEARSLGDIGRAMPPFLQAFLRESARLSGERREVAETKRWVLADLKRSFSVEEAAMRVGMSPSNFAHVFKKDTGNSFIDFVNTSRMERARELLLGTDLLVRQVADAVGIESLSHFGQLFRRSCGLSPNELRNSRKDGRIPS